MADRLEVELAAFENTFAEASPSGALAVERLCAWGYRLVPRRTDGGLRPEGKAVALTFAGLVHGNESAGVAVLNELASYLMTHPELVTMPLAFVLGNPWAAREGRRFLERDLNRSFDRTTTDLHEDRRARELEAVLAETAYFVDFHQTMEPSANPFFIFPYGAPSYELARAIEPRLPIVTHWGKPFSQDGRCSDEYVNTQGGTGITLELGQNGFSPYHVAAGFKAGLGAVRAVGQRLRDGRFARPATAAELYTWAEIVAYPKGDVRLDEGWYNFRAVNAGDRLGDVDGKPLVASVGGRMLFPKYVREPTTTRPAELCRIIKPIAEGELGR